LAVETARSLAAGTDEVPSNLRGSVRAALALVDRDGRRLVEIAAVAARPLEPTEIDQLSLQDAATDALQSGLLVSTGGRIAFRHALLRQAAYEEIAEPHRRGRHQQWARALLASDPATR